tara:strand:+ start:18054 stop:18896 length:843 start_codon:yes stop_codon:yes gene_type:complete
MSAGPARAQDAADLGRLAEFVQWGGVAFSVVILAVAVVILRTVERISTRLGNRFVNRRPTIQKIESAGRFIIYIATIILAVRLSFRLDATALTVVGGGLAFAVGFAMRDLVAAVIAGITIMFDRPFQVGDRVEYAGQYGDIVKIGLRSIRMNTLDHNVITIPNNKVLTDVASSANYGALEMQVPMDFYIATDQDVDLATTLVQEACLTSPYVYLGRPSPFFIKQAIQGNFVLIHIKVRPYVFDSKFEKSFESDVHLRVIRAFRDHHISAPTIPTGQVVPA